jgi:hypothetical protein
MGHQGQCRLCGTTALLMASHIIPKFVFRWLKETSATGYFRWGMTPDRRQQDGRKQYLLCDTCEQRFSSWERPFAESVFTPLRNGPGFEPFEYDPWLAKFAASLSWRVLIDLKSFGPITHVPDEVMPRIDAAEKVWRHFLLDKREYISPHDLHLIPLGFIESSDTRDLPPNINRYFARTISMDLIHSDSETIVFTKLPFLIIVGIVQTAKPWEWKGTRIMPGQGRFGEGKQIGVPGGLFNYLTEKAKRVTELHRGLSARQKAVINETIFRNPDRAANSEGFRAMVYDLEMFGSEAFAKEDQSEESTDD